MSLAALTPASREDVAYHERTVPSSQGQIDSAVARAIAAGAVAPLDLQGLGMTAWVFCDARGVAYKVARRLHRTTMETLANEAEWLRVANAVPGVRMHVARFHAWRPDLGVIVRECVRAKRRDIQGRHKLEGDLWDLHRAIERAMLPYGFAAPELKADSYVLTRDRGPVLVDAGFALKTGSRLARDVAERHRDASLHRDDLQLERGYLRAEYGRTIPQAAGERLERKLAAMRPNPVRARRGSDSVAKPRLTRGHLSLPETREAAKRAARTTLRTGFSWRDGGTDEDPVYRHGRAELVGTGNFGMVYRVDDARGPIAVKLPAAHDLARAAWTRDKQTDWMRQEAGVANELAAKGYTIVPRGVYTEFGGGTPAFVREWGEPAASITGPEYAEMERQLLDIERRHGWRVHDDLVLYRRADGTLFVGDVGFWEAPRPGPKRKWEAMQSDLPYLVQKLCKAVPVLSPESAPASVRFVTDLDLLARLTATHHELRKDIPPRGLDLKMARELLDGVATREAAGIPTARLFLREMKMARAMIRAGEPSASLGVAARRSNPRRRRAAKR